MPNAWWNERPVVRQWRMTRNCMMTPQAFMGHLCGISVVLAALAVAFALQGCFIVAGFCLLQVAVVVVSGLVFAVHATDGEHITLYPEKLVVQQYDGWQVHRYEWHPHWVRIEEDRSRSKRCFWLCQGSTRLALGSQLDQSRRAAMVADIARALRTRQESFVGQSVPLFATK